MRSKAATSTAMAQERCPEPITVMVSEKGWIRAQKGHIAEDAELRFKEGDALHTWVHAQSTDRIVLFATNGKAYTLKADAIPRGRGDGQREGEQGVAGVHGQLAQPAGSGGRGRWRGGG